MHHSLEVQEYLVKVESRRPQPTSPHVEYAERGTEYCILFRFSLFCEYVYLEYVRIHAIYRVNQAECVLHILVVAPKEYGNLYSTRRPPTPASLGDAGCAAP